MANLVTKLAQVSKKVGGALSADKTNQEQRYDYISADKILTVCGQALAENGVVVFPSISAQDVETVNYTNRYGKESTRYDANIAFVFTVADDETNLEISWSGRGSDYSTPDKALYKAITSGHKYFLMKLLNVGAGNEDSEHEPAEQSESKPAAAPKPATKDAPKATRQAQTPTAKVAPEPKTENGNGTAERPYTPDKLHTLLKERAEHYEKAGATVTEQDRNILAATVNAIFGGDETQRYELFKWLTGEASTKKIPAAYVIAMKNEWLKATTFGADPDPMAAREARIALAEALKAAGQEEMF